MDWGPSPEDLAKRKGCGGIEIFGIENHATASAPVIHASHERSDGVSWKGSEDVPKTQSEHLEDCYMQNVSLADSTTFLSVVRNT